MNGSKSSLPLSCGKPLFEQASLGSRIRIRVLFNVIELNGLSELHFCRMRHSGNSALRWLGVKLILHRNYILIYCALYESDIDFDANVVLVPLYRFCVENFNIQASYEKRKDRVEDISKFFVNPAGKLKRISVSHICCHSSSSPSNSIQSAGILSSLFWSNENCGRAD